VGAMTSVRIAALVLVAITVGACGPDIVARPTASTSGPSASLPATVTGSPSGQASGVAVVPGSSAPWWLLPPVYTPGQPSPACGLAAVYRVDGGAPSGVGYCAGLLVTPPVEVALRVGQVLDLHMTSSPVEGGSSATSGYPLPTNPAGGVLRAGPASDNGTTGTFVATRQGTTDLMTEGACDDTAANVETDGPCPVIRIRVTP